MKQNGLVSKLQDTWSGLQKTPFFQFVMTVVGRYTDDQVPTKAAALVYYLIFSIFPLLILLANVLGLMNLDMNAIGESLKPIVPADIITLLQEYLEYIHQSFNPTIFTFSIVFSIWFPLRVVKELMVDVREAYHLPKRKSFFASLARELICTLLMPVAIFLSFILILLGANVISFFMSLLPTGTLNISGFVLVLWQYLRFVAAAVIMGFALSVLYALSLNGKPKFKPVLPGVLFSMVFWLIACGLFSFYVENFSNYSVIYGTLGAFIVLLLWLYLTGVIFILGGEINGVLYEKNQAGAKTARTGLKASARELKQSVQDSIDLKNALVQGKTRVENPGRQPLADIPAYSNGLVSNVSAAPLDVQKSVPAYTVDKEVAVAIPEAVQTDGSAAQKPHVWADMFAFTCAMIVFVVAGILAIFKRK